jgi:UDP-N-acetylmuramate--alanine ligase
VIDDYAHHPVEIRAVLAAAREAVPKGRVIAVVQPHRYTRLRDLMDDFQNALQRCRHRSMSRPVYPPARSRSKASIPPRWSRA